MRDRTRDSLANDILLFETKVSVLEMLVDRIASCFKPNARETPAPNRTKTSVSSIIVIVKGMMCVESDAAAAF